MNIPDNAVNAASEAIYDEFGYAHGLNGTECDRVAEVALRFAAPFIAAQALKDHATAVVTHKVNAAPAFFEGMKFSALLAMDHASHIEEEQ